MDLRPGGLVLWDGRVCRLDSLSGARARKQETIGPDIREVPVTELRGVPSFTTCQLDQRLKTLLIPRWTETDAFRAFVVAYGRPLPLRKPSPFGDPEMIRAWIKQSDGITGRVTWLVGRAAEIAIQDSSEFVDSRMIERVSERLRLMAS